MPKRKPHRREEKLFANAGYSFIAGADEAGKGAWAGPIVAAAVILTNNFEPKQVNDSKVLTKRQRERMFVHITRNALSWAVGVVSSQAIDRDGIQAANRLAIQTAIRKLDVQPEAILVDALPISYQQRPVKAIIHGDAKSLSIAAASIVAKVVRDALMDGHHRLYPNYGFQTHKGYGTAGHRKAIEQHGYSAIHRHSFSPMNGVKKNKPKKKPASRRRTKLVKKSQAR